MLSIIRYDLMFAFASEFAQKVWSLLIVLADTWPNMTALNLFSLHFYQGRAPFIGPSEFANKVKYCKKVKWKKITEMYVL